MLNLGEMLLGGREMVECVEEQRGWVLYMGGTQQYRPTRVTYAGRQDGFPELLLFAGSAPALLDQVGASRCHRGQADVVVQVLIRRPG